MVASCSHEFRRREASVAARPSSVVSVLTRTCVHQLCTQVPSRQVDGDEQCSVHTFMEPSTVARVGVLLSPAQLLCSCVWCGLGTAWVAGSARFGTIIGLGDCQISSTLHDVALVTSGGGGGGGRCSRHPGHSTEKHHVDLHR
jgi:hypothetical protein